MKGLGTFGRTCEGTGSPLVTGPRVLPIGPPSLSANTVCTGRKDEDNNACSCGPTLRHCHTCRINALGVPQQCMSCKNSRALDENQCVLQSDCKSKFAGSFEVVGTGKFGLRCVDTGATPSSSNSGEQHTCTGKTASNGGNCRCTSHLDDCHVCGIDGLSTPTLCTKCKNLKYLLNGKCVDADTCTEAGGESGGGGKFGCTCKGASPAASKAFGASSETCTGRKSTSGGKCWCSKAIRNCYKCSLASNGEPDQCLQCKNSKALFNGQCIAMNRCAGKLTGTGKFDRICV